MESCLMNWLIIAFGFIGILVIYDQVSPWIQCHWFGVCPHCDQVDDYTDICPVCENYASERGVMGPAPKETRKVWWARYKARK
jgi:hypothetical protein